MVTQAWWLAPVQEQELAGLPKDNQEQESAGPPMENKRQESTEKSLWRWAAESRWR